jgi:hypothetical protein
MINQYVGQSIDVAHLIQVSLTPVFLISAVGVILNVMTSRLARIVDRARVIEERLHQKDFHGSVPEMHRLLHVAARRARHMNRAITWITVSALLIAVVVISLFVNAFLRWDLSAFIALLFILTMVTLAGSLLEFLIEVRIATASLRIGIIQETGSDKPHA